MKPLDEVAVEFIRLFEAGGFAYALMGGLAVRLHALPRPTFDVDFTVLMPRTKLPRFYELVQQLGYSVPDAQLGGWIDTVSDLPVIKVFVLVEGHPVDIDIFLAETEYQREILRRRQQYKMGTIDAWFITAEDLILLKLLAGRPKDLVDIGDVFFIQGSLDANYLDKWANRLGVFPELEKARQEVNNNI